MMKKFPSIILGVDSYTDWLAGIFLLLLGLTIIGDGQIGVQATSTSEVKWITVFAALPKWFGWMLCVLGIDSFFGGKLLTWIINKILVPVLKPIAKSVVGEERLKRLQERLSQKHRTNKWLKKTYGSVLDEEALDELTMMAELKTESPELFGYFYQLAMDRVRHKGITPEILDKTVKYFEGDKV